MVLKQFSYDVGYPVYGAKFLNENTLLITGGGGEGNNGIPNKLTALKVDFSRPKALKKYRELSLLDNEDSPMSLDCNNGVIVLGVNQNSEAIKQGENKHFRKFVYQNEHLKPVGNVQISESRVPTEYQKLTVLTPDGAIAVIAVSTEPSSVYVVDTEDMDCQYEIKASGDVKDISISPDGKVACYITASTLETVSTVTGKPIIKHSSFKDFTLGKISFLDSETILISGVMKQGGGVVLAEFSIPKKTVTKSKVVAKKLKGITSMDVSHGLVALAGSDTSVTIVKTSNLKTVVTLPQVHNFAITKIAFSPDGSYLASVSAANTVNIIQIPPTLATAKSKTSSFFHYLFLSVLVVLLSIFVQWFYSSGLAATTYRHAVDLINKKPQDSSPYFKIEPIDENETFVKVPTSYTTTSSVSEEVFTILPVGEPDVKLNRGEPEQVASILPVGEPDVKVNKEDPKQVASILPVGEPDVKLNKEDPEQVASILPVGEPDVKIDKDESDKIFSIQPVGEPIVHADGKDEYVEITQFSKVAASKSILEEPITNTIDIELAEASPTDTTEGTPTSDVAETSAAAAELGSETEEEFESEPETESYGADPESETDTSIASDSQTESELESETEASIDPDSETESELESEVDVSLVSESETESELESERDASSVSGSETEPELDFDAENLVVSESETESELESTAESPVLTETETEAESEPEPETPVVSDVDLEVEQETESELKTEDASTPETLTETESEAEAEVESDKEFVSTAAESPIPSDDETDFLSTADIEASTSDDESANITSEHELPTSTEVETIKIEEEHVTEVSSIKVVETSFEEPVEITESLEEPLVFETDSTSHAHLTKSESFSLTSASELTQESHGDVEEVTVQVTLTSTLTQTVFEEEETGTPEPPSETKPVETVAVTVAVTATATVVETVFQTVVQTVTEKVVETSLLHGDL